MLLFGMKTVDFPKLLERPDISADVGKAGDESCEAVEFAPERISLTELWPAYLRKKLTVEALRNGLQGGLWVLDANLDVDFPWQADDAILIFRNGAALNTFAKEGAVKLTACRLVDTVLDFQGACTITLIRCDWQGNYDPASKRTALTSNGQALTVTDCQFSTRHARALSVVNHALVLTGSRFTRCGHAEMDGGAIWHTDHPRTIENCRFDRCLAALGGALWVNSLYGVVKCEFVACESRALQKKSAGDVAVYVLEARAPTAISGCVFRQTSLSIGNSHGGTNANFVISTQFQKANIYYHTKYSSNTISRNCVFLDGREIEKKLA